MSKAGRVQEALRLWANWAGHRVGTELYSVAPGFQEAVSWRTLHHLDDTEAEVIDSAVALLKRYDEDGYQLIRAAYLRRLSGGAIAEERGARRGAINAQLRNAEAFIAGVLATHSQAIQIRELAPA